MEWPARPPLKGGGGVTTITYVGEMVESLLT